MVVAAHLAAIVLNRSTRRLSFSDEDGGVCRGTMGHGTQGSHTLSLLWLILVSVS